MRTLVLLSAMALWSAGSGAVAQQSIEAPTLDAQSTQSLYDQRQCVGKARPQIAALLAQFPEGGAGLRNAVVRAVQENPSLADDVAAVSREANAAQKRAIGAGLADTLSFFAKIGSSSARAAQQRIERALKCCDRETLAAATMQLQTTVEAIPGFNAGDPVGAGSGCVSPSRPGC